MSHDIQIVILGEGDPAAHKQLTAIRDHFPQKLGLKIGFDEGLAHRVEGGADAFLMPSQFEPSGLNQLYSLRYGTVPIVRAVGGLYDTITDCTPETLANQHGDRVPLRPVHADRVPAGGAPGGGMLSRPAGSVAADRANRHEAGLVVGSQCGGV